MFLQQREFCRFCIDFYIFDIFLLFPPGKGDLFGIDLQYDEPVLPSSFSVKSLTYCELQGINTLGFINVLSLYPTVAEVLSESVQRELTFNLKDGEDTGLTDVSNRQNNFSFSF